MTYFGVFHDADQTTPVALDFGGFNGDDCGCHGLTAGAHTVPCAGIDLHYEAELHSVECNALAPIDCWTNFVVGLRWIELDESAFLRTSALDGDCADCLVTPLARHARTSNDLVGIQIGAVRSLWDRGGFFTVDGVVKSGIYANFLDQSVVGVGGKSTTDVTYVAEFDLA